MVSQSDTIFNAHGEDHCLVQPSALCEEILADAQARAEALAEGKGTAPSTPSPTLNSELDGGFPVGLTVLHGAPGVGKTAFALQCACVAGCPVLFITTELPPALLLLRITSRVSGVHWKELRRMRRNDLEPLLRKAVESVPWLLFADFTRYVPKEELSLWGDIHRFARAIWAYRWDGHPHPASYRLLVVDSVHTLVRMANVQATEYDALTVGLTALDTIAKENGVAILGVAERSRGAMRVGGQSASAGHRLFEYIAEAVLGLDAGENTTLPNGRRQITLSIHKNRWGDLREGNMAINLVFDPRTMTFTEEV